MKKLLLIAGITFSLNAFAQPEVIIKRVEFKELQNYFLKTQDVVNKKDLTYIWIEDQAQFDELFGVAKTMNNHIVNPDFENNYIVALAAPESRMETYLAIKRTEIEHEKDLKFLCIVLEGPSK